MIRRSLGPNCTVPDNGCLNNIHRMIRNTNWTGHKLFTNRPRIQYFVSQFLMAIQTVSFSHLYDGVYMTKTRKQEEESRMAWRLDWTNGLPNCSKEFELPPTKLYYVLLALDLIIWPSHNSYKFFRLLSFLNGKVHFVDSSEGCGFTLHDQRSFCDFAIKHRNDIIFYLKKKSVSRLQ